jgi:Glycosyl-hydrolase 97 N-terminal
MGSMKIIDSVVALGGLILATTAVNAQPVATASSPDGAVSVAVTIDGDGRAAYAVTRKGKPILAPSKLGFLLTDAVKIDRRLTVTGQEVRDFDETWTQPWGEWQNIRNRYRELKVHLKESTALARVFTVTFRRICLRQRRHCVVEASVPVEPRGISLQQNAAVSRRQRGYAHYNQADRRHACRAA